MPAFSSSSVARARWSGSAGCSSICSMIWFSILWDRVQRGHPVLEIIAISPAGTRRSSSSEACTSSAPL
jgi:hypothetical protein